MQNQSLLLPAGLLPRRRDSVEGVGAALNAYGGGQGHRRIAAQLGLPVSTVRNWLRGFSRQAERLRTLGTVHYHRFDTIALPVQPTGSAVCDALEALGLAARAAILRHGIFDTPWAVINVLTSGGLLNARNQPVNWP